MTKTDAEGIAVTHGYDDHSRLTAIDCPAYGSMSAWSAAYTYDQRTNGKGRLSNITAPNGPLAFEYDARGRLIQRKTTLNSVQYVLTRTFTPAGRVTGLLKQKLRIHGKKERLAELIRQFDRDELMTFFRQYLMLNGDRMQCRRSFFSQLLMPDFKLGAFDPVSINIPE